MANGQYIHQVFSEGTDATTVSSDLFESVTGIDFHYKYDHISLLRTVFKLSFGAYMTFELFGHIYVQRCMLAYLCSSF